MRIFKTKPTGRPRKGIYKKCEECNKDFYCIQYRIKSAKYCSISCGLRGKNNWRYKGGTLNWAGYKLISNNGKQIREHRYILEKYLGRKLRSNEEVHHKNGDKTDNRIENLEILSKSNHSKISYLNREIDSSGRFIGWTSWYCPVKKCDTIIYNKSLGSRKEIQKHKLTHRYKYA